MNAIDKLSLRETKWLRGAAEANPEIPRVARNRLPESVGLPRFARNDSSINVHLFMTFTIIPKFLNPLIPKLKNMKSIVGFGALNLDLIYEVDDLRTISTSHFRLEPGEGIIWVWRGVSVFIKSIESFGNFEIEERRRFGSKHNRGFGPDGIVGKVYWESGGRCRR